MYEKYRLYKNYAIIGIISVLLLGFLPFVGSEVGLAFVLPTTTAGWIVYITTKTIIAAANILILYCFVNQGKFNIRNDERYIAALTKLGEISPEKKPIPLSPAQHYRRVFGAKGTTLFITSILGTVALTQAILTFDANTFLTYLFTLVVGLIFGALQMEGEEVFWTEEFPQYVDYLIMQNAATLPPKEEQTNEAPNN